MEMVELPVNEKITIAQRRAAAKSQSSQKTSGAWMLISALPERFRTAEILTPSAAPTSEMEAQYTALYSVVIALISLSGGTLQESKLDRYLRRFNVDEYTPFAGSVIGSEWDKMEKLLKRMEKDRYIVKIRDTSGGEETVDYVVGPRGKVEVGDQGVAGLVRTVFGEDEDADELERRLERSLGVGERKRTATQQNGEPKKRGRKRRDEEGGEEDGAGEEDSDEG